jgi:cell division protein FtsQ
VVLEYWTRFSDELAPEGLELQHLKLDARGAWSMDLTNGTVVKLGRQDAHARLQRLMRSWDALLTDQPGLPSVVDLRYTNGFAVSWTHQTPRLAGNEL